MSLCRPDHGRQRGFGLVEMMIAMVLGLLLAAAAIQVFLSTRASQQYNQALAEIQDSARFAMHVLSHDLRMVGYTGCPSIESTASSVATGPPWGSVNVIADSAISAGITGSNLLDDALVDADAELPESADDGSDPLRLAYMRDYGVRVIDPSPHGVSPSNANVKVSDNAAGWEQDDVLLVTDCRRADLFAATSVSSSNNGPWINIAHASSSNSASQLSAVYEPGSRVLEPYAVVYYVHENGGLYRREYFARTGNAAVVTELVSGISHMVVRYGVDNDGNQAPDGYRTEAQVTAAAAWDDVVAVRIGFMASSETLAGESIGEGDELSVLGETVDMPDDGRLRQVFATTVALRNRVP